MQRINRSSVSLFFLVVFVVLGYWLWSAAQPRFTDDQVSAIKESIRAKFEAKGYVVDNVALLRESARHLSGFATIRKPPELPDDMTKNCRATMGDDGSSFWTCE